MYRIFVNHETTSFKTIQDSIYDNQRKEKIVFDKLITIRDTEEKAYDVRFFLKNYEVVWGDMVFDNHILNVKIPYYKQQAGFTEITKNNTPKLGGDKRTELTYMTLKSLFRSAINTNNIKLENNIYYIYLVKSHELDGIMNDNRRERTFLLWKDSFEGYNVNFDHIVSMYFRKMWVGD